MSLSFSALAVKAVMAIGTRWTFSERFWAVTTTSSRAGGATAGAAPGAVCAWARLAIDTPAASTTDSRTADWLHFIVAFPLVISLYGNFRIYGFLSIPPAALPPARRLAWPAHAQAPPNETLPARPAIKVIGMRSDNTHESTRVSPRAGRGPSRLCFGASVKEA